MSLLWLLIRQIGEKDMLSFVSPMHGVCIGTMPASGESVHSVCLADHTDAVMMSSLGMFERQSSNSKQPCAC